jgi:hypothetical protein
MIPQYFPWLWDDRSAWEQTLSDPRYSYDLPFDSMMSLYEQRRLPELAATGGKTGFSMAPLPAPAPAARPGAPAPLAPLPTFQGDAFAAPQLDLSAAAQEQKKEEESEDGILSQSEIDALLEGLE